MAVDQVFWILAAISWGLGAVGITAGRLNWLLLGLMFAALTFVF